MKELEDNGIVMTEKDCERCEKLCRFMSQQLGAYGVPEGLVRTMVNETIFLGRMMGAEQAVRRDVTHHMDTVNRLGEAIASANYRANMMALGIDEWN